MARKKSGKTEKKLKREPWIQRQTGLIAITIVSIALTIWVAWQVIAVEQNIAKGILWGVIFGASIWLVFFGMNYFHSWFGGDRK